jgi:alkanesulfonate monooxygenase SsuD/methylene tetrahydromethanopterin reductase-like flavin-dependent oxidoreductase (luciferase family)
LKIGLQIYYYDWPGGPSTIGPKLVEIARTAEESGFHSLWVMDHFFQLGAGFGPPELTRIDGPMLEGYSTMSYLAAATTRLKLGLMMTGNVYRTPGLLIKTVTTLDVLSGGRAYLGIGTGWNEFEAAGLGISFPSTTRELVDRLEETLQIAKHMWAGKTEPFEGPFHRLANPLNSPQPLSRPHPPIIVGMWLGGRRMIRLTATYADGCNLQIGTRLPGFPSYIRERFDTFEDHLEEKPSLLRADCEDVGRPYEMIERTVLGTIRLASDGTSPAEVLSLCERLQRFGIDHVIFNMPNVHEIQPLEILGVEVIPAVAAM